ncbi:MAG: membrane protein [marine bacterium B5-7]|nr:MAG: membrane protein [marine bacterium B5-7]
MSMNRTDYIHGVLLVILGGSFLSLAGVLLRHIESADGWQILFYRSVSFFVTLTLIVIFRYRRATWDAFVKVGARGIGVAVALGLGSCCYVFAMLNTTVANVVFIVGASPLVTAGIARLVLKEQITSTSLVTMLCALGGIGLMFSDGFISGGMIGNVMAIGVMLTFTIFLLLVRDGRRIDMIPATCMAGLVAAAIAAVMADTLLISSHDFLIALTLGSVQFGVGFILLTIGARYIPAAEVALFSLSEAVLAPIWVWIGVNEVPSTVSATGAAVVLVSVTIYCLSRIVHDRQSKRAGAVP